MSKPRSQNINIYLADGNPYGIRKIYRSSNSNIRLFDIPRGELAHFCKMDEAAARGIYLLFGNGQLYIGQSNDLGMRLKQHDKNKSFWQRAFAVVLNNDFSTLDHLYYLEKTAIEQAQAMGRFALENGTSGSSHPHFHDTIRSDCENIFDEIETLLAVVNWDFFTGEELNRTPENLGVETGKCAVIKPVTLSNNVRIQNRLSENDKEIFYCRGKSGGNASGFYTESGFTLLAKSLLVKNDAEYQVKGWKKYKNEWIKQGILISFDEQHWQLTINQKIDNPSKAAALVVGGNRNGWEIWKNAQGQTLDEVYRKTKNE